VRLRHWLRYIETLSWPAESEVVRPRIGREWGPSGAPGGDMESIHVSLNQPVKVERIDEEIITLAGIDLGFIMPGKPPQVLQIDASSASCALSLRTDDVLVGIDDTDTRNRSKEELEQMLHKACRLTFERVGFSSSDGDQRAAAAEAQQPASSAANDLLNVKEESTDTAAESHNLAPIVADSKGPASEVSVPPPQANTLPTNQAVEEKPVMEVVFETGMSVRLVGFQNAAMNGAHGRLGKFSQKKGVWQVFLDSTDAAKAVKPQNLEAIEGQLGARGQKRKAGDGAATPRLGEVVAAMDEALRSSRPPVMSVTFDGPGPAPGPDWHEDVLPQDDDKEAWLETLRDSLVRQLRQDAEAPEPAPFNRASYFASPMTPGRPLPEGKFPAQALHHQLQMLLRAQGFDNPGMFNPYGNVSHSGQWRQHSRQGGKGGYGYGPSRAPSRWYPWSQGGWYG